MIELSIPIPFAVFAMTAWRAGSVKRIGGTALERARDVSSLLVRHRPMARNRQRLQASIPNDDSAGFRKRREALVLTLARAPFSGTHSVRAAGRPLDSSRDVEPAESAKS